MAKLHHKLEDLTNFINEDLRLAHQNTDDVEKQVELATATISLVLDSDSKAQKMRSLIEASQDNFNNHNHPYNMPVAVFISKHHVMNDDDYLTIKSAIDNLSKTQQLAKNKLPFPRKRLWGIF